MKYHGSNEIGKQILRAFPDARPSGSGPNIYNIPPRKINPVKTAERNKLKIAMEPDSSIMRYVTEKGFFLDGQGKGYMQQGGKFYDAGEYNPDVHGLPVPLVKKQKNKRSKLQIA